MKDQSTNINIFDRRVVSVDAGDNNRRGNQQGSVFDTAPWWLRINYLTSEILINLNNPVL